MLVVCIPTTYAQHTYVFILHYISAFCRKLDDIQGTWYQVPVVDFMLLYFSFLGTCNLFLHFIYEVLQLSHMNHSSFQLLETP